MRLEIIVNSKTMCIHEIKRCEELPGKPEQIEYSLSEKDKAQMKSMIEKSIEMTRDEKKKNEWKNKLAELDVPRMIDGIDYRYGDEPYVYYEIEFTNSKVKNLAVGGSVRLIDIPVQENEISISKKAV
jgi:hypothetical protein